MTRGSSYVKAVSISLALMLLLSACSAHRPAPVRGVGVHAQGYIKANGRHYVVARGDTLYSIAWQAGTDVTTLARHNGLRAPYRIYPGQTLRLDVPGRKRVVYRVRRGDTLSGIARRTNHSVADLASLNGLRPPYRIYVGQQLALHAISRPASKPKTQAKPGLSRPAKPAAAKSPRPLAPARGKAYAGSEVQKRTAVNAAIVWQWPVKGPVISGFSVSETGNKGIDIRGSRGQAVKAAAAGKVVYAGNALRGYGNLIIIKHNDDYLSAYAHNEVLRIKEQDTVRAGQHIADMGSSDADDVRLHFEIRHQGKSVDPRKYLPKR
ncbi:LysM peptidoglycan-binding domain-containing protein [Oceanimonas sp. CHS3-5]|uniref:LysM peptidoglycan-binding domain-containing protein n=1 Tax=Oceanimonas sp. CHS3-5 TaxID=3068186 RepID=UPI00273E27A2|nr:LysM peptidoglycan-binding domain-containing protein [Oceanimonas sp. CHS3-5]MDP5292207.1 LysM peptidoglycan-binding domain-containing protein [Oceanimonas sp. CHS3-5]